MQTSKWTEEEDSLLKKLYEDNIPVKSIAEMMKKEVLQKYLLKVYKH